MVAETAAGSRAPTFPLLALAMGVVAEIAYILLFTPFVTVDAGTHIASAAALVDSLSGFDVGQRFLEWNPSPEPNLVALALLSLLIPAVGIAAAETVVLIGYVIALSAAAWYAVRSRPGSEWLVLFVLPITFSLSFLWGFLSFSYSVAVFLVVTGYLLRTDVGMPTRRTVTLGALMTLAFFTHFVGYLAAGLLVVTVLLCRALFHPQERHVILLRGAAAIAPSAVLGLVFLISSNSASASSWGNPITRLAGLVTLKSGIVAYERVELVFCLVAAVALWTLILAAVVRHRPWRERDPDTVALGAFTLAVGLVAIVAPHSVASGGSILFPRLALFPILGAVLWLTRQHVKQSFVIGAAGAAAIAAVGLAVVRYDELRSLERLTDDLVALAPCVERGSTIVQGNLAYVPFPSSPFDPHSANVGRIAARRDALDIGNSDWGIPFSVQRFRDETDPYERLVEQGAFIEDVPPPFDLEGFSRVVGEDEPDYVVLWGRPEMSRETKILPEWKRFETELRERYALAARSRLGWWELWAQGGSGCPPRAPEATR